MRDDWPFAEPPDTPVITTRQVLARRQPIRCVSHDGGDGVWQMLCGSTDADRDARMSSLGVLLDLDVTLAQLADLPCGWQAWREEPGQPWQRGERDSADDDDDDDDEDEDEDEDEENDDEQ